MTEEYMPVYHEIDGVGMVKRLTRASWPMIAMAAFCFIWCVYMFVTPPYGGAGLIMITPENGPAGLAQLMPWCSIVMGVIIAIGSYFSRESAVLGFGDVLVAAVMVLAGVWGIYTPGAFESFAAAYTVAGTAIAIYLALAGCELYMRSHHLWYVELICAFAVFAVSLAGSINVAAAPAQVGFFCIAFFIAAWGFVYAALSFAKLSR